MSVEITVDSWTLAALIKAKDYADKFGDVECAYLVFRFIRELEARKP